MVTEVIEVDAIEHRGRQGFARLLTPGRLGKPGPFRLCQGGEQAMQFLFAGVAAVDGVAGVGRILQLGGGDLAVDQAQPGGLELGLAAQMGGQGGRDTGHGHRPLAQLLGGDRRHQGAVDAAGIGHQHLAIAGDAFAQGRQCQLLGRSQGLHLPVAVHGVGAPQGRR